MVLNGTSQVVKSFPTRRLRIDMITYRTKSVSLLQVCVFFFLLGAQQVFATELYFLDGCQTFLYKTLNWWYYAAPGDDGKICGAAVRYRYEGKARHSYDESRGILSLEAEDGFADLLSVLSRGGSRHRSATFQGRKGDMLPETAGAPILRIDERPLKNRYVISLGPIARSEYRRLTEDLGPCQFILEGTIRGLRNGKMALYRAADNLRNCPNASLKTPGQTRLTVYVFRKGRKAVLAEFALTESRPSESE